MAASRTRYESLFPKLNRTGIALLSRFGKERSVDECEILIDFGEKNASVFVVLDGNLEIVRVFRSKEKPVMVHGPGEFTGEADVFSGSPSVVRARASKPCTLLEIEPAELQQIVQMHSLLNEVFLRAYLLRRANLIWNTVGDALLVGSKHSAGTLRLKAFLGWNACSYTYLDLDHEPVVQRLLDQFAVRPEEIPIVICRGRVLLRNPSNAMAAASLKLERTAVPAGIKEVAWAVREPEEP
jgi:thioredoxin reductase (NADPH)